MTDRPTHQRLRITVRGFVQGVGFRPFVHRLAAQLSLSGLVRNHSGGVTIEVEGDPTSLACFTRELQSGLPPLAELVELKSEQLSPTGERGFRIESSQHDVAAAVLIPPDVATCHDCLRELFDPNDRRYRYPFINCTNCGPRFTIVESIPYDRPKTSMKSFPMCECCQTEYDDPTNRRFHAQPNACPVCGPKIWLYQDGETIITKDPIATAVEQLQQGKILAVRGVGGFHLVCDAHVEDAVRELRRRKGRAEKPFALMAPSLDVVRRYCVVGDEETTLLSHYSRPIVLLEALPNHNLAPSVAPHQNRLGFMLAYTPLHHLLMKNSFDALVATSGNRSEEPIAIDNGEAIERLSDLADAFLLHDREILQRCDDSVVRLDKPGATILRRARGFVPRPVFVTQPLDNVILATGPEMKNTAAISRGNEVFLSQHVGDLDSPQALTFFEHVIEHLKTILEVNPELIACDLHPEYLSTKWALKQSLPVLQVQHHHAHLAGVMADCDLTGRIIGVILDGTGYGTDGTIWGGEVLIGDYETFDRHAWLEPVPMPGGSMAIRQPWRMALSHLAAAYDGNLPDMHWPDTVDERTRSNLIAMMKQRLNSPMTSSCGRLFDAVSAMLGVCTEINYDAQAAIELEMIADPNEMRPFTDTVPSRSSGALSLSPLIRAIVESSGRQSSAVTAARFHASVGELFVAAAKSAREASGLSQVALSGGVFNNRLLLHYLLDRLHQEKFTVYTHRHVPTNDGGLALGQVMVAHARTRSGRASDADSAGKE